MNSTKWNNLIRNAAMLLLLFLLWPLHPENTRLKLRAVELGNNELKKQIQAERASYLEQISKLETSIYSTRENLQGEAEKHVRVSFPSGVVFVGGREGGLLKCRLPGHHRADHLGGGGGGSEP